MWFDEQDDNRRHPERDCRPARVWAGRRPLLLHDRSRSRLMESTFGDRQLHERTLGRKNAFYVSPQQLDLIMYLLYQCSDNATKLRDELAT
jgi:hypothetical protein